MSALDDDIRQPQLCCAITRTSEQTHDIIRANFDRSPLFAGAIEGRGPRYCPSIEDKVKRFANRDSHQIFLEPEGLDDPLVYPNGISTSLPLDTQADFVRSIAGLERVEIARPGYAVEYEYVDPRRLNQTLEVRDLPGLFLAGQINGTTGYEEAAAQGLVAGLNAASVALGAEEVRFDRRTSYIGVMVDDLTLQGVSEPYRMMTARAEYRLSLRADNATSRLGGRRCPRDAFLAAAGSRSRRTSRRVRSRRGPRRKRARRTPSTLRTSPASSASGKSSNVTPACGCRWSSTTGPFPAFPMKWSSGWSLPGRKRWTRRRAFPASRQPRYRRSTWPRVAGRSRDRTVCRRPLAGLFHVKHSRSSRATRDCSSRKAAGRTLSPRPR